MKKDLVGFFQSYFQEVRHLTSDEKFEVKRDVVAKAYLNEFVDSFPDVI